MVIIITPRAGNTTISYDNIIITNSFYIFNRLDDIATEHVLRLEPT